MSKSKNTNKKRSSFLLILTKLFVGNKIADMTVEDERYDSPGKLAVKRFFRKPLAVGAVVVLVAMFAFVIIGPMTDPIDLSYSESLHANIAPTMSMMKIPSEMKEDPRSISSYGSFTVGVSKEGKVYTWGYYKASSDANNVMKVPAEVQRADILYAAAGFDHVIAIDGGYAVINDGNFDGTLKYPDSSSYNMGSSAIMLMGNGAKVDVYGGTFKATEADIFCYAKNITANVHGGNFNTGRNVTNHGNTITYYGNDDDEQRARSCSERSG